MISFVRVRQEVNDIERLLSIVCSVDRQTRSIQLGESSINPLTHSLQGSNDLLHRNDDCVQLLINTVNDDEDSTYVSSPIAGRCYLCTENGLPECLGSDDPNSPIFTNVLKYYTEPCNGQCVLFRDPSGKTIRGCSWTYGHMQQRTDGWYEITPGILSYFCDSNLCNGGILKDLQWITTTTTIPTTTTTTTITTTTTTMMMNMFMNDLNVVPPMPAFWPRRIQQCYTCTERLRGCGEYLDPRYASNYIRPCLASCMIFRNPSDDDVITRDCSTSWPDVRMKNGLQKLLGSDAFFCDESLCNGVGFDFLLGIFYNQLPAIVRFTTTSTTTETTTIDPTTTLLINPDDEDPYVWDDEEFESTEPTTLSTQHVTMNDYISNIHWWIWNETTTNSFDIEDEDFETSTSFLKRSERLSMDEENETLSKEMTETSTYQQIPTKVSILEQTTTEFFTDETTTNELSTSETAINTTQPATRPTLFEYCKDQQCLHGGRLTSDCLCICLPAFTGDSCETVLCDQEPAHICSFLLEHECEFDSVQYLCPKFCHLSSCLNTTTETSFT